MERNGRVESGELEGSVPPESGWLNRFQNETPHCGTRLVLWTRVGVGRWGWGWDREAFYPQGIWAELQQETQGPGDGFTLQECIQLGNYDFSQVNIPFSYFSL